MRKVGKSIWISPLGQGMQCIVMGEIVFPKWYSCPKCIVSNLQVELWIGFFECKGSVSAKPLLFLEKASPSFEKLKMADIRETLLPGTS